MKPFSQVRMSFDDDDITFLRQHFGNNWHVQIRELIHIYTTQLRKRILEATQNEVIK